MYKQTQKSQQRIKLFLFLGEWTYSLLRLRPPRGVEVFRSGREVVPRDEPLPQRSPRRRRHTGDVQVIFVFGLHFERSNNHCTIFFY